MNLPSLRQSVDTIDHKILKLLAERNDFARQIAHYKKEHNIAQLQPGREKELLEERKKIAQELGIQESTVEKLFQAILAESHAVQAPILGGKTAHSVGDIFSLANKKFTKKELKLSISLFDLFTRIYANFDTFFFLESLGQDKEFSRFSYVGFGPKHKIQARKEQLWIDGKEVDSNGNPWEFIKKHFPMGVVDGNGDFKGGLVGYASFEAYRYKEKRDMFADNEDFFDFEFGLYLEGIKYDLHTEKMEYFSWESDRSAEVEAILKSPIDLAKCQVKSTGSNFTDEQIETVITDLKQEIENGNVFQIVPSRKYFFEITGSTLEIYKRLREQNPSPHMFFLKFDDRQIIGSSPELVARVEGGKVESYPIAGTRSRGATEAEDLALEKELLNDEKEIAEHLMLVDMARDDLGRVCEYGSVKVDKLKIVKKFSHVQHIVSHVSGTLAKDKTMFDAVMTSFPMGTVSGAPRIEAVKLLHKHEKLARGPYAGFVGFFSFSGEAIAALAIRSLFIHGKNAYTQAGAGVVYDSVPEFERKEIDKKSQAMKKALNV